jgi:hypothetical protein
MEKLESKEAQLTGRFLAENPGNDGGSLARNKAGRGGSRRGDRQMDGLIWPKDMR